VIVINGQERNMDIEFLLDVPEEVINCIKCRKLKTCLWDSIAFIRFDELRASFASAIRSNCSKKNRKESNAYVKDLYRQMFVNIEFKKNDIGRRLLDPDYQKDFKDCVECKKLRECIITAANSHEYDEFIPTFFSSLRTACLKEYEQECRDGDREYERECREREKDVALYNKKFDNNELEECMSDFLKETDSFMKVLKQVSKAKKAVKLKKKFKMI
jgi:hypothetical protein